MDSLSSSPDYLSEEPSAPADLQPPLPEEEELDPALVRYNELIGIERVSWPFVVACCEARLLRYVR